MSSDIFRSLTFACHSHEEHSEISFFTNHSNNINARRESVMSLSSCRDCSNFLHVLHRQDLRIVTLIHHSFFLNFKRGEIKIFLHLPKKIASVLWGPGKTIKYHF